VKDQDLKLVTLMEKLSGVLYWFGKPIEGEAVLTFARILRLKKIELLDELDDFVEKLEKEA